MTSSNLQRLGWFILSVSICLALAREAPSPSVCPATVFFGSGIWTDRDDATMSMRVLRSELRRFLRDQGRDLPGGCFGVAPATPQGFTDLIESANFIAQDRFRGWWRSVFGRGETSAEFEELFIDGLRTFQPDPDIMESDLQEQL